MLNLIVPSNPTPNGDIHLGHLAGPFIAADVLRRAASDRGESVAVLLGTAWQNTHVLIAAERCGEPYLQVAAAFASEIEASFASAGIGYDVMLRHGDIPAIEAATQQAYQRLQPDLVVREGGAQFCPSCSDWRFQGFVGGSCPHCGSADAAAIDCEGCGVYHDDSELLDAHCTICASATEVRPIRRAYLELEPLRDWFTDYFSQVQLDPAVRRFAEDALSRPLPAVAVTFAGSLGFSVPDPALADQRIYPAFELAPRYSVMMSRYLAGSAGTGGAQPEPIKTTMLFGFDNAFERIFLFPAVLRTFDRAQAPRPDVLAMSFFYLLDGLKFSTSRGHLVGVRELIAEVPADAVRLYLCASRPETATSDFTRAGLAGSAELSAVQLLGSWADTGHRPASVEVLADRRVACDATAELAAAAAQLQEALLPETMSCLRAADAIVRLAGLALADNAGPQLQTAALRALAAAGGAVIPDTVARLQAAGLTDALTAAHSEGAGRAGG